MALALFTFLFIIACSPSSYAVFRYFSDNQGVGARSYVLKRGYFKSKTCFYNNHVATFKLAKLHLVGVHPNPGPSEYDIRHTAGLKTLYMNSRSIKALVTIPSQLQTIIPSQLQTIIKMKNYFVNFLGDLVTGPTHMQGNKLDCLLCNSAV